MAALKATVIFLLAHLLLVILTANSVSQQPFLDEDELAAAPSYKAPAPSVAPHWVSNREKECPGLCSFRCSLHSRPNLCNRACKSCCWECSCVPAGTSGNREGCGKCWAERLTHNNRTKCP